MGKVFVQAKLVNHMDEVQVCLNIIKPEQIRSCELNALVDTGAVHYVINKEVMDILDLPVSRRQNVRYADGRVAERTVVEDLRVFILGRDAIVPAIVEENGKEILIGRIALEQMDLIVDPTRGTVGPRPESPDEPLIDMFGMAV